MKEPLHTEQARALLQRFRLGLCTDEEIEAIEKWYEALYANDEWSWTEGEKRLFDQSLQQKIWQEIGEKTPVRSLRKLWIRCVAAAVLILAIGSGIYYFSSQSSKLNVTIGGTGGTKGTGGDVAAGTNRAILTIDNNEKIDLAINKTGININSTITYNDGEKIADAGQMLQLTTPRGGQYQVVLPDGSKVWLNAASSIKFPSKFNSIERRVEVSGEVYFEIEKDVSKPFKVLGGGQEIEVLGTSFNVNVYDDEPTKRITLITGKIGVSVGAPLVGARNHADSTVRATTRVAPTTILNPNEQAQISTISEITKIKRITVQTNNILAWKNGFFNLEDITLSELMRQVERWYNVRVRYEGAVPDVAFKGEMDRNIPLSGLIRSLAKFGVKAKIEGQELIISNH